MTKIGPKRAKCNFVFYKKYYRILSYIYVHVSVLPYHVNYPHDLLYSEQYVMRY